MNDNRPTHLDLFSGIGGFSIAFEAAGFRTIGFAENEPYASAVLRKHWPCVPNFGDVRAVPNGFADVVTAGVPCQPASINGERRGTSDERWLWPDALGIISRIRPGFAVFENPPAILSLERGRAFNGIVSELVALGFSCWWDIIPVAAVGSIHLRERLIIVAANNSSERIQRGCEDSFRGLSGISRHEDGRGVKEVIQRPDLPEPSLCRSCNEFPNQMDRLRCLGNSVNPRAIYPIAQAIFNKIEPKTERTTR